MARERDVPGLRSQLEEIARLREAIPAYQTDLILQAYHQALESVFGPNHLELQEVLERPGKDPDLAIELFQNVREPIAWRQFEAEVHQRLHNYVAASMTLVEHSRRLLRGRKGRVVDSFAERLAIVNSRPEAVFVAELRNFIQHRSLPIIGHRVEYNRSGMIAEVGLDTNSLRRWKKWPQLVREYLGQADGWVDVRPIVRTHAELVRELNVWLLSEMAARNAEECGPLIELQDISSALFAGMQLDDAWQRISDWRSQHGPLIGEQSLS